jgi:ubiquinone/menaquinone biosynthesis C-methylase UbiE
MELKEVLTHQFGNPAGTLGSLVGWSMALKNRERNNWGIEKMKISPDDKILEIGFGPGYALKLISGMLVNGSIVGVDRSEVMYNQAFKRNSEGIQNKKVELLRGCAWDVMEPDNSFDKIFACNVHFFWEEPEEELKRLRALLKTGGKLCLIFQPRWAKSQHHVKQIAEDTKLMMINAGLKIDELAFKSISPVTCIYLCGIKT